MNKSVKGKLVLTLCTCLGYIHRTWWTPGERWGTCGPLEAAHDVYKKLCLQVDKDSCTNGINTFINRTWLWWRCTHIWQKIVRNTSSREHTDGIGSLPMPITNEHLPTPPIFAGRSADIVRINFSYPRGRHTKLSAVLLYQTIFVLYLGLVSWSILEFLPQYNSILVFLVLSCSILVFLVLSHSISGYLWLCLAISGYLWLSMPLSDNLWQFMVVSGKQGQSRAILANLGQSQAISSYLCQSPTISGKFARDYRRVANFAK